MALLRKLVNKKSPSRPPPPRWLVMWPSGCPAHCMPFVNENEGEDIDASWQVVMDATFEGYSAFRINDSIYLVGQPSGFSGERQ